nr:hypothetical protein [uncultured Holophaga sp.]
MRRIRTLIALDDTDDLESRGTGEIAGLLARELEDRGLGSCGEVTRHQLLLDPAIPYTSHNSAMCFPAHLVPGAWEGAVACCSSRLEELSVPGSDPGLCMASLEALQDPAALIAFGHRAKVQVIAKAEAMETAGKLGIHLSEHGGSGQGIIGALAGTGLRLSGQDGRFMGKLRIPSDGGCALVEDILRHGVDEVRTLEGKALAPGERVQVGSWVKRVLLDGCAVLMVTSDGREAPWRACDRLVFERY